MDIQKSLINLQKIGLTQSAIAAEIGCDQSTVSDITRGKSGTTRTTHKIFVGIEKLVKRHARKIAAITKQETA